MLSHPSMMKAPEAELLRAVVKLCRCCKIYLEIHLLMTHEWFDGFKHKMYYITLQYYQYCDVFFSWLPFETAISSINFLSTAAYIEAGSWGGKGELESISSH